MLVSRVGGIARQITPGTGLLLDDPTDLLAFGDTLCALLSRPKEIADLGAMARLHVLDAYVGDEHLIGFSLLVEWLVTG